MLEEIRSKANMNYYGNEYGAQTDIITLLSLIDKYKEALEKSVVNLKQIDHHARWDDREWSYNLANETIEMINLTLEKE